MQLKTKAIVVGSLRYGESDLIVKLFTKKEGLASYLLKGVLKSKKGKLRASFFLPFTLLDIDVVHKPNRSLKQLKEAKPIFHFQNLHSSIVKGAIVTFLSEILSQILIETEQDEALYQFVESSILFLESSTNDTLFHIYFLIELTAFFGCYPQQENRELPQFSLENGCFTVADKSSNVLEGEILSSFKMLLGINFDTLKKITIPKAIRKQLLDKLLLYYSFHIPGFRKPKSLMILEELFS